MRRAALLCLGAAALLGGCRRERRELGVDPPAAAAASGTRPDSVPVLRPGYVPARYEGNAYALNQGRQLFGLLNCSGCHAHGGGGMGPPLMDSTWIYGSAPDTIFATIVRGRPNGMPDFAGRLPDHQVWQLVAYVRSMSGLAPFTAAPGRPDAMFAGQPENSRGPVARRRVRRP